MHANGDQRGAASQEVRRRHGGQRRDVLGAPGEIFGILSPNGAGKTPTVECLQGLRSRDGGTLEMLGLDPNRDADRVRRRTGSQLQSSALPDRLRVGKAIALFASRFTDNQHIDVASTLEAWSVRVLGKGEGDDVE
jgi:ABC-2 type transport system ATP-binding protein